MKFMEIRIAQAKDLSQIMTIWNDCIENSTVNFRLDPYTTKEIVQWFERHSCPSRPALVAVEGEIVKGFAALSEFRSSGYWPTAEDSVYVEKSCRGQGIAIQLMEPLLAMGKEQGLRTVVAVINKDNASSIQLHQKLGFFHVGDLNSVGEKFGIVLSSSIWHKIL